MATTGNVHRTNTLEANRAPTVRRPRYSWRKYWYRPYQQAYQVPQTLYDFACKLDGSAAVRTRWRDYVVYLSTNASGGLVNGCCWITDADGSVSGNVDGHSIAQSLERVQKRLVVADAQRPTVFAINSQMSADVSQDVDDTIGGLFLQALRYLNISVWSEVRAKVRPPATEGDQISLTGLVEHLVVSTWSQISEAVLASRTSPQHAIARRWSPVLPSSTRHPGASLDMQSAYKGIDFVFAWMHDPPQPFLSSVSGFQDWNIYVTEPFVSRPVLGNLRLLDVTKQGSSHRQLALIVSSADMLRSMRTGYENRMTGSVLDVGRDADAYFLDVVLSCIIAVRDDICNYRQASDSRLEQMDLASRRDPSVSKVQWLRHLKECHDSQANACRQNALTIVGLLRTISPPSQDALSTWDDLLATSEDFDYLAEEISASIEPVADLIDLITAQVDLFDKRRSKVIGLLLAIYVPLAFATSLFGMNIEDLSGAVYQTNTTVSDGNVTEFSTTLTATDQPGNYTWPLWQFGAVAGPLILGSIILPLIAGRTFRAVSRYSIRYRKRVRAGVSLVYFALNVIAWAEPVGYISTIIGIIIPLLAVRHFLGTSEGRAAPRRHTQILCWLFVLGIWALGFIPLAFLSFVMYLLTLCVWLWVLVTWTTAPKGRSWYLWRGL